MSTQPDFSIERPGGTTTLLVEVKGQSPSSREWASKFRQYFVAHGAIPADSYFLLAAPDSFYLWSPRNGRTDLSPDFVADSRPLLEPYLKRLGPSARPISEQTLELFVYAWLSEVLNNPDPRQAPDWIQASGLLGAIQGARLRPTVGD
jgi:hypothetical protein